MFSRYEPVDDDVLLKDYVGCRFKPLGIILKLNVTYNIKHIIFDSFVVKNVEPPLLAWNGFVVLNLEISEVKIKLIIENNNIILILYCINTREYFLKA